MKKTIIVISVIIALGFITLAVLVGVLLLTENNTANPAEIKPQEPETASPAEPETEAAHQETKTEDPNTPGQKILYSGEVKELEIYLDGYRDTGIFLGQTTLGQPSLGTASIYGEEFSDSGFSFSYDNTQLNLEPGSIHYIYLYAYTEELGWTYKKQKLQIPGTPLTDSAIRIHLDKPTEDLLAQNTISFLGWAADTNSVNSPGISNIEVYMDGPKGFGKPLGQANYGSLRGDVADVMGNPNYANCGFTLDVDLGSLEPGSTHTFYIYAYSASGNYQVIYKDITYQGKEEETDLIFSYNSTYMEDTEQLIVEGWIAPVDFKVQKVIFVSNINGNEDLYSINIDGTDLQQLTDSPGNDWYPSVSIDGKKIAYSNEQDGYWQIITMNWDGTDKKQLTNSPEKNGDPTWSYDGKYIYFEKFINGDWEIYRMDADGNNVIRLTNNPQNYDWHPFAHTSEHKVLFESGQPGSYDIYIMDLDGQNIIPLNPLEFEKRVPSVSLDGKKIIFQGFKERNYDIFIMDSQGLNTTNITNTPVDEGHSSISPDNKRIAFQAMTGEQNQIYIMDIDGSNKTRLFTQEGFYSRMPAFLYQLEED
ncbi:MAG: DUF5050 domain-containing protein [Actinomycetota bacterium]|nr:DUF5050 domain-containing protein [Actinomycetota bacterium]